MAENGPEAAGQGFDGKVALVTGAGRGIGRAIALELAAAGARVAIVSRTGDELEAVAAEIEAATGRAAVAIAADVGDPPAAATIVAEVTAKAGPVDVLVNNAGVVWPMAPTASLDPAEWEAALQINLFGPFRLTRAVLPGMVERDWGRIVNVSSKIVGKPGGLPVANAYATSKSALEAHSKNLATALEDSGVAVSIFRPGEVDTAMQGWIRVQDPARVGSGLHDHFMAVKASGQLLTPERTAALLIGRLEGAEGGELWDLDAELAVD